MTMKLPLASGALLLALGCSSARLGTKVRSFDQAELEHLQSAQKVDLANGGPYKASFALLIGNSSYQEWDPLEDVPREMNEVKSVLEQHQFEVTAVKDLDGAHLKKAFTDFIALHGSDPENRLLFFFSGHGHSTDGHGYIVATDAPKPPSFGHPGDRFLATSIPMTQFLTWSSEIKANHVLFVFDSCFSGSVFTERGEPEGIREAVSLPSRQFLAAGTAKETVPAISLFAQMFIEGLSPTTRAADLNKDNYVTGAELGFYLRYGLPLRRPTQHPRSGWHPDPKFSEGDIVFALGPPSTAPRPETGEVQYKSDGESKVVVDGQAVDVSNGDVRKVLQDLRDDQMRRRYNEEEAHKLRRTALEALARKQLRQRPYWIWGARGAYAAAVGSGALGFYFMGRMLKEKSDSAPYCMGNSCQQVGYDLRVHSREHGVMSTVFLWSGVGLAVAGLTAQYYFAPSITEASNPGVTWQLTPGGLVGRW
jgi:hypothetical protein